MTQQPITLFVRAGNFFFRYRDFLFPAVFLALALASRPRLFGGSVRSDLEMDLLGIAIIVAGHVIRAVVIGYAYIMRGGKNKRVHAATLVQDGVFAHCRNPLYVGNIFAYTGLIVIYNTPLMYTVGLPFFVLAYFAIVTVEEQFLRGKFGQAYDDYCARVPRFLASLKGIRKTFAAMEFNVKRVVRKDYGSIYASLAAALAIMIWERRSNLDAADAQGQVWWIVGLLIVASLGYVLARVLKKTHRLDSPEEPVYKQQDSNISRPAA